MEKALQRGCALLKGTMSPFGERDIGICRGGRFLNTINAPTVKWEETAFESVDSFLKLRQKMIDDLNDGSGNSHCEGCGCIRETDFDKPYRIYDFVLCTSPDSICNLKCSYCYSEFFGNPELKAIRDPKRDKRLELVTELERRGFLSPKFSTIHFSDGEICVDPNRKRLFALAKFYKSWFYTNATIFSDEIASLMKAETAKVYISVDAGTNETFMKLKGAGIYDKVCDNILRYSKVDNTRLNLKYIFIPGANNNYDDIDGFINLCSKARPIVTTINTDASQKRDDFSDANLWLVTYMLEKLSDIGLFIDISGDVYFSEDERNRMIKMTENPSVIYTLTAESPYQITVEENTEEFMKSELFPMVIYGAGFNAENTYKYLVGQGVEPVCFVDKDPEKWGKEAYKDSELLVYPLQDYLDRYGLDLNIYISVLSRIVKAEITYELVEKYNVSIDKIFNYEPYVKRNTCSLLEHTIAPYGERDIGLCRGGRFINITGMPTVPWTDDPKESLDNFLELRKNLLDEIQTNPEKSPCFNCIALRDIVVPEEFRVVDYVMSTAPESTCNFKCSYCYAGHFGDNNLTAVKRNKNSDKRVDLLREMERRGLVHPTFTKLHFSDGEICVDPKRKNMFAIAEEYYSWFYTNASIFSEEIAALLRVYRASIYVSLDAGTRETFKKIKGVDNFYKVCNNLRKYADINRYHMILKYIYLPGINDSKEDLDGFVYFCSEIKVPTCSVNVSATDPRTDMKQEDLEKIFYLINKIYEKGIRVETGGKVYFSDNECDRLYELAKQKKTDDCAYLETMKRTIYAKSAY
jgi:MoaA/NifB/PqqE/SkfB family radical SAM enzyme